MTFRRLLPFLSGFLLVGAAYFLIESHYQRRETQEAQAKKVFKVKPEEITHLTLTRPQQEIVLEKQDKGWQILKPIKFRADTRILEALLLALTHMEKLRDLPAPAHLKDFGLEPPSLVLTFTTAGDRKETLSIGARTPGAMGGFYARRGQEPQFFLIRPHDKEMLDREVAQLRDRTLFRFNPEEVTAFTVTTPKQEMRLEKTGPQAWRWVGRDKFEVRGDRVELVLGRLSFYQIQEFLAEEPRELKSLGLAPKPPVKAVIGAKTPETITLGAQKGKGCFALLGAAGPLVLVDARLLELFTQLPAYLEDLRLWRGPNDAVHQMTWGPSGKKWTAVKHQDQWKLKGPEGQELQHPAPRLAMALDRVQDLERLKKEKAGEGPPPAGAYAIELSDAAGKILFRLEEVALREKERVELRYQGPQGPGAAVVSQKAYTGIQKELERLHTPDKKK